MMKKIKTGVYGLDTMLGGGLNDFSNTVIIGVSGAGKTTMATQFIRRGLELGQDAIFISLDENREQIIKEAREMGWADIERYTREEKLVFIDASGRKFRSFVNTQLPDFAATWEGAKARIVIDPLTPVIWAIEDKYEQRELLSNMFKMFRRVGTVMATLEEHHPSGQLQGEEVVIPMYLSDNVIYLCYRPMEHENRQRNLRVIKARNSRHLFNAFPYQIIKGMGLVVHTKDHKAPEKKDREGFKRRISDILKEKGQVGELNPKVKAKIEEVIETMDGEDIRAIKADDLVHYILDSY